MNRRMLAAVACALACAGSLATAQVVQPQSAPSSAPASTSITEVSPAALEKWAETRTIAGLLETARSFLKSEDNLRAQVVVDAILKRDPAVTEANLMQAELAFRGNKIDVARQIWMRVRAEFRNNFQANLGLGRIHLGKRSTRSAEHYLVIAESVAPPARRAEVLRYLAQAYRANGKRTDALSTLDESLRLDNGNYEARALMVMLLTENQDWQRATDESEALVRMAKDQVRADRSSLDLLQQLYSAYETQAQVLTSRGQQFLVRNPDGTFSERVLAGRQSEAAAVMNKYIDVRVAQAELSQVISDHNILAEAEEALTILGKNVDLLMKVGLLRRRVGRSLDAVALFEAVLKIDPTHEAARTEALELLSDLIRINPDDADLRARYDALRTPDAAASAAPLPVQQNP